MSSNFNNGLSNNNSFDGTKTEADLAFTYPGNDNIRCESYIILNGIVKKATGCKADGWVSAYTKEEGQNAKKEGASGGNQPEVVLTKYENGTVIYFNPVTGTKCNQSEAVSTPGTKTGCMKWYTFNDTLESTTVNLILDHNTTIHVAWNSGSYTAGGMKEVATSLTNDTSTWITGLNPRLISADEIIQITNNTSFSVGSSTSSNWFFLDSKTHTQSANSTTKSEYAWLFDYTYLCKRYGCNIEEDSSTGYWTSTPIYGSQFDVWRISCDGSLHYYSARYNDMVGIRPVITISKANI